LYGTTRLGGQFSGNNAGTVFRVTFDGTFSRLYSFTYLPDGIVPNGLALGDDGNFYGTTSGGGFRGGGTIFRLVVPQCSFTRVARLSGGAIALTAMGPASQPCRLWTSAGPALPIPSWTLLASRSFDNQGKLSYTDSRAPGKSARFYRLSMP